MNYVVMCPICDVTHDHSLRKKLDDAHELSNQIAYPPNQFIDNPAPAINHQPSPVAGIAQPSAIEAEAEIRTEPESLNLNDLGRQMVEKALGATVEIARKRPKS